MLCKSPSLLLFLACLLRRIIPFFVEKKPWLSRQSLLGTRAPPAFCSARTSPVQTTRGSHRHEDHSHICEETAGRTFFVSATRSAGVKRALGSFAPSADDAASEVVRITLPSLFFSFFLFFFPFFFLVTSFAGGSSVVRRLGR